MSLEKNNKDFINLKEIIKSPNIENLRRLEKQINIQKRILNNSYEELSIAYKEKRKRRIEKLDKSIKRDKIILKKYIEAREKMAENLGINTENEDNLFGKITNSIKNKFNDLIN